jgi:hypothetical protein
MTDADNPARCEGCGEWINDPRDIAAGDHARTGYDSTGDLVPIQCGPISTPAADANADNPARIWLQPPCCATSDVGRLWCEDPDPVDCEDGVPWTEYVRADIAAGGSGETGRFDWKAETHRIAAERESFYKETIRQGAEIARLRAERDAWREMAKARGKLLDCYESGDAPRATVAFGRVIVARDALRALGVEP